MTLSISASWEHPVKLRSDQSGFTYECETSDVLECPGVYVFYRKHGDKLEILYIGRTINVRRRLHQHLNSVKLMRDIYEAKTGSRYFIYCQPKTKPGQRLSQVLAILENALIDHAMSQGHDLRQKQGVRPKHHLIEFTGNRTSEALAGRLMRKRV